MNKLLLIVLGMLSCAKVTFASPLTPDQALARALNNVGKHQKITSKTYNSMKLSHTFLSSSGQPGVFLFTNTENDFLVVGANTLSIPLLGYGTYSEGELPPQFKWWLQGYSNQIAWADSISKTQKNTILQHQKKQSRNLPASNIEPLLTTTWNQLEPFNMFTPVVNGQNTPTGCVATAMAQIINYRKYPTQSVGTGYAYVGEEQLSMSLDISYDWTNMADSYWSSTSAEQNEAVAKLMQACGYSVGMMYAPQGSGAYDAFVPVAMTENFQYDKTTWLYYRDNYSLEQWSEMLVDELTANGPLYYSGVANEGGHAFVFDGYDSGYFHVNWGWGGYYDGWFLIDALNPAGQGTGGFEGGYNTSQSALLGTRLPVEGSKRPQVQLTNYEQPEWILDGNFLESSEYIFYNLTAYTALLDIAVEMIDQTTGQYEILQEYGTGEFPMWTGASIIDQIYLPTDKPNGRYTITLATREQGYDEWLPILSNYYYPCHAIVEYIDGKITLLPSNNSDPATSIEITDATVAPMSYDQQSYYSLSARNDSDTPASALIKMVLVTPDNYVCAETELHGLNIKAHSSIAETVPFSLFYYDIFEPDVEYWTVLVDPQYHVIFDMGYNKVSSSKSEMGEIYVSDLQLETYIVQDQPFQYSYKITNTYPTVKERTYYPSLLDYTGEATYIAALAMISSPDFIESNQTHLFQHQATFDYYDSQRFILGNPYMFALLEYSDNDGLYYIVAQDSETTVTGPQDGITFYTVNPNSNVFSFTGHACSYLLEDNQLLVQFTAYAPDGKLLRKAERTSNTLNLEGIDGMVIIVAVDKLGNRHMTKTIL